MQDDIESTRPLVRVHDDADARSDAVSATLCKRPAHPLDANWRTGRMEPRPGAVRRSPATATERRDDEHRVQRQRELGRNALGDRVHEEDEARGEPEGEHGPRAAWAAQDERDDPDGEPQRRPREAGRDPVQDLRHEGDALARGQVGVPGPDPGDDLAIAALLLGVVPHEGGRVGHARVDVVGRAPDEAVGHGLEQDMGLRVGQHHPVLLERRRGRLRRRLLARRDPLAERRLHQEVPVRLRDPAEVRARVLPDRLDRRVEHDGVVLVAAEYAVREGDQPDGLVVRPVREVRAERHAEALVRLLREHLLLDERGETSGRGAVSRRDGAVVGEDAEEGTQARPPRCTVVES